MSKIVSIDYKRIVNQLQSIVTIENFYTGMKKTCKAVWDTGAMMSAISTKLFRELAFLQMREITVNGIGGKVNTVLTYANIYLKEIEAGIATKNEKNEQVLFQKVAVTLSDFSKTIDVILGMDIITKGELVISTDKIKTLLTFEQNI